VIKGCDSEDPWSWGAMIRKNGLVGESSMTCIAILADRCANQQAQAERRCGMTTTNIILCAKDRPSVIRPSERCDTIATSVSEHVEAMAAGSVTLIVASIRYG
jgi:hypothetical protein